jgi:PRTRC genetic system protein E
METNFFERLNALQVTGIWKIAIQQDADNQIKVSVLLTNDKVGDDARKLIAPLTLKGTPQELDTDFFTALQKPMQQTDGLLTNMEHYLKQLEEAKVHSKMEQDKEGREKREKEERKKKFAEAIKRVDELEEKKQYQQAIAALPKADAFPEQEEEIKKRLEDLRQKNGQLTLM